MENLRVAYLGPEGSYTHQAALKAFTTARLVSYPSIPSVFHAVQAQKDVSAKHGRSSNTESSTTCDKLGDESPLAAPTVGIVPLENSTNGPVASTLDSLADLETSAFSAVEAVKEVRVRVKHCLLGKRHDHQASQRHPNLAVTTPKFGRQPLPDLSSYTTIYSHPQVWGQVTEFLHAIGIPSSSISAAGSSAPSNTPNEHQDGSKDSTPLSLRSTSSTSQAASLVASDPTHSTLAISSALAVQQNHKPGLEILMEGLEDTTDNVTRFLVLTHRRSHPAISPRTFHSSRSTQSPEDATDPPTIKRVISFTLPPQRFRSPGALADTLAVFKELGLDLTSINARPVGSAGSTGRNRTTAWEYTFVVEVLDDKSSDAYKRRLNESADVDGLVEETDAALRVRMDEVLECGRSTQGNTDAEERKAGRWRVWGKWDVDGLDGDGEDAAAAAAATGAS